MKKYDPFDGKIIIIIYNSYKNIYKMNMWKTKEEMNPCELLELRLGYMMVSKTIKGKTYYQVSLD